MKRSRFLMMILVGILSIPSSAMAAFSDVVSGDEHFAAVQWMESRNVIQGYEDGTLHPEWEVNRAEALKIILLAKGITVDTNIDPGAKALFPDVKADQWFYAYVGKALELGIISGYPDGTFRPAKTVNLAEVLKMLYRANDVIPTHADRAPYADVPLEAWFVDYAQDAKTKHLIQAHSDGYLSPGSAVIRGSLIEIVYRFSYVQIFEKDTFPLALNWPLYHHPNADVAFQIPFGWKLVTGTNGELVAWVQDDVYHQSGWDRTTPLSAVVTIMVDQNEAGVTTKTYFDRIREGWGAYGNDIQQPNPTTLMMNYEGPYEFMQDMVIALPGGIFVTVQATYGKGRLAEQLRETIQEIDASFRHEVAPTPVAPTSTLPETMTQARSNIQADGKGQQTLDFFTDRTLIETDTIGVGTGPVDYFYSAWADVTLKYERSFDVILDIKTGQTSTF